MLAVNMQSERMCRQVSSSVLQRTQYNMGAKWILLVMLVFLALHIQPVHCPQEPRPSPVNNSTLSNDDKDPCENSATVCSVMVSSKDQFIPWFSSTVSCVILLFPVLRIKDLKPKPRTDAQTLFCWFLYLGFWDYVIWIFYFWTCFDAQYSAFPVIVTCGFGSLIHLYLSVTATLKTSAVGDGRSGWFVILTLAVIAGGSACHSTQIAGWLGVALSVLSHSCRIASTDYYAKINWYLFSASTVGSVNGFLWLVHPQLCISREYKIGSYIVGCLRGLEAFLWISRSIAKFLSKMEGETIEPPAVEPSAAAELQPR